MNKPMNTKDKKEKIKKTYLNKICKAIKAKDTGSALMWQNVYFHLLINDLI